MERSTEPYKGVGEVILLAKTWVTFLLKSKVIQQDKEILYITVKEAVSKEFIVNKMHGLSKHLC